MGVPGSSLPAKLDPPAGGKAGVPNDNPFPGWECFVPHLVHPLKVAIVEALLFIGEPLSAVQLGKVFRGAGDGFRESNVRYHLNHLAEVGVLGPTADGPGGGPREKFFDFANGQAEAEVKR
jgi:hypothetical protein